ncbi:MAG: magnesium-dependent phosphatase-1 [Opitutales bacterium]|nr:magnesium-dependent phosphatase-1 [Opitutales bacterium]
MNQPGLVVFDLDFTLWDCGGTWCDCLTPPFSGQANGVCDAHGRYVQLYQDVILILETLDAMEIPMALASRTQRPDWARQLLDRLGIRGRFQFEEIFPGSKVTHLNNICDASGISLDEMLFFDDEMRNLHDLKPLGVQCIFVPDGLNHRLFKQGLELFSS